MELEPFHVTRSPASVRSCKASDIDPEHVLCSTSVWMKTKRIKRSTRAECMVLRRPDSRQESDEVGTKTTVRLCSMHSNTAFGAAANRKQTTISWGSRCVFFDMYLYFAHTVPWQDISVVKAEAVAKSFFQNTLQKTFFHFI